MQAGFWVAGGTSTLVLVVYGSISIIYILIFFNEFFLTEQNQVKIT